MAIVKNCYFKKGKRLNLFQSKNQDKRLSLNQYMYINLANKLKYINVYWMKRTNNACLSFRYF